METLSEIEREQSVKEIQRGYIGEMCIFVLNITGNYILDNDLDEKNMKKLKALRKKIKLLGRNVAEDKYDKDTMEDYVQAMCKIYDDFSHYIFTEIKDYDLEV